MVRSFDFDKNVKGYTIKNKNGMEITVISLGAILQSVIVPDREGNMTDVVLGYDDAQGYLTHDGYIGSSVGRFANRIKDSKFTLNGVEYKLTPNEGKNQLHGGIQGFNRKLWASAVKDNSVTFSCVSEDMEEGFPGRLTAYVTYSLDDDNVMTIAYNAQSNKDTVVNMTNHSYFNLNGAGSGPILDHKLTVRAGAYTPIDAELIPTGELRPVDGTALDFRFGKKIGEDIDAEELKPFKGYDNNFALCGHGALHPAVELYSEKSGIGMKADTTLEGVQIYTGNYLDGYVGKGGKVYEQYGGVCAETQHFPDSPNKPMFVSPVLREGELYSEKTTFKFTIGDKF